MTDIVLQDIDAALAERLKRAADARGWTLPRTLLHLLEQGLRSCEIEGRTQLDTREDAALREAIVALERIPDDAGYALIGRVPSETEVP